MRYWSVFRLSVVKEGRWYLLLVVVLGQFCLEFLLCAGCMCSGY